MVIDASVAFKWLIPDDAERDVREAKECLASHMRGDSQIHVPALLYYEVGNILALGRNRPPVATARRLVSALHSLPLKVAVPAADLDCSTLRIADSLGLSFYDASYVALAEQLECPLITADARLAGRAGTRARIRLLKRDAT